MLFPISYLLSLYRYLVPKNIIWHMLVITQEQLYATFQLYYSQFHRGFEQMK